VIDSAAVASHDSPVYFTLRLEEYPALPQVPRHPGRDLDGNRRPCKRAENPIGDRVRGGSL
jgi:hypothetical protein